MPAPYEQPSEGRRVPLRPGTQTRVIMKRSGKRQNFAVAGTGRVESCLRTS